MHRSVDLHQRFLFPIHSQGGKKDKHSNHVFMIRNDFAPKRLSVPRLESKPAPEQTLQKWRLPSKKLKTDPVQALQCNAWEPRQAQHSDPTEEERSLKGAYLLTLKMLTSPIKFSFPQGVTMNSNKSRFNPSFVPFIKVKLYSRKG